jgi:hypothetical protein
MKEEARTNIEVEAGLPEELTLESVHLKFQEWRSQRKRGAPIPEELWSLAVDLTETKRYSMRAITKTLNIGWEYLTRRMIERKRPISKNTDESNSNEGSFIELKMDNGNGNGNGVNSSNSSCFPLFGSSSHCILDIHKCDGSELKFYFPSEGDIHIDMIMVFEMFLNSGISVLKNRNKNSNGNKIRKKKEDK